MLSCAWNQNLSTLCSLSHLTVFKNLQYKLVVWSIYVWKIYFLKNKLWNLLFHLWPISSDIRVTLFNTCNQESFWKPVICICCHSECFPPKNSVLRTSFYYLKNRDFFLRGFLQLFFLWVIYRIQYKNSAL